MAEATPTEEKTAPPARATVAAPRAMARLNPSIIEDHAFLHCGDVGCPACGRAGMTMHLWRTLHPVNVHGFTQCRQKAEKSRNPMNVVDIRETA
ncbi:hypothetical protein [Streptomyces sp. C10]|uniref:hypothetical protein n=1 Tax=Streptomyces sp. C10 TaxID=531941 RepID=UPI00397F2D02